MSKKVGKQTIEFENSPTIESFASVAGEKESQGPLGKMFDKIFEDEYLGQNTFEEAESQLQKEVLDIAIQKADIEAKDIDYLFAGDLLNQCAGSTFGLSDFGIPHIGIYGACSTMALGLGLASCFVESGLAKRTAAVTSSHFCASERQFRYPLEYGGQRTPTAQWTVTGAGAVIVSSESEKNVKVKNVTFGRIVDLGITDVNNMGAAMAPAAADTVKAFLDDTKTSPADYDLIVTGDLGQVGSELFCRLLEKEKIDVWNNHFDCGMNIFFNDKQDTHSGGSGCGCSGSVLCSRLLKELSGSLLNNILFCATGSLHSPTTVSHGTSIPGIAHLVNLKSE